MDDSWLQARLPLQRTLEFEGVRIGMLHDAGPAEGRLARMRRRFPDADAVIFGHSHIPLHETAPTASRSSTRARPRSGAGSRRTRSGWRGSSIGTITFELLDLGS